MARCRLEAVTVGFRTSSIPRAGDELGRDRMAGRTWPGLAEGLDELQLCPARLAFDLCNLFGLDHRRDRAGVFERRFYPGRDSYGCLGGGACAQHHPDHESLRLADELVLDHVGQLRERGAQAVGQHDRFPAADGGEAEHVVVASVDALDPPVWPAAGIGVWCERDGVRELVAD